jgi:hypothetical protein
MGGATNTLMVGASTSDIARAYSPPDLYLPTMNHLGAVERIHLHSLPNGAQTAHFCSFATQNHIYRAAYRRDGAHSQTNSNFLAATCKTTRSTSVYGSKCHNGWLTGSYARPGWY